MVACKARNEVRNLMRGGQSLQSASKRMWLSGQILSYLLGANKNCKETMSISLNGPERSASWIFMKATGFWFFKRSFPMKFTS